ncbi:MAG: Hsp70 family protein, partial [Myxococcales bacterium]
ASDQLGRKVHLAVICVPAWFTDRQRQAVLEAAQLAELDVVQIVSEPTAVAIAFGAGRALARKRLLVYDLGGGTFDASVLEATGDDFEVVSTGGDNFLGGLDFDLRVADELERVFARARCGTLLDDALTRQRIRDAAEAGKIALSDRPDTQVRVPWAGSHEGAPVDLDVQLTRDRLEALTVDLVDRATELTRAVLEARQLAPGSINEILLVGGQSQMPLVRRAVEELFGKAPTTEVEPHDGVAIGAAMLGRAARDDDRGFLSLKLSEVLTAPIGIGMRDGKLHRVLDRNTRLPCQKSLSLPLGAGGQLRLALYQGDEVLADRNEYLGALTVQADVRGELSLDFDVSRDGVLSLSARTGDGRAVAVSLATADAPDEVRAA